MFMKSICKRNNYQINDFMKSILLMLITLVVFLQFSCSKQNEYRCTCRLHMTSGIYHATSSVIEADSSEEAEEICHERNPRAETCEVTVE